jgi:hypothetical protein
VLPAEAVGAEPGGHLRVVLGQPGQRAEDRARIATPPALGNAKLGGADLSKADLRGADLRRFRGMSADEVRRRARTDSTTRF